MASKYSRASFSQFDYFCLDENNSIKAAFYDRNRAEKYAKDENLRVIFYEDIHLPENKSKIKRAAEDYVAVLHGGIAETFEDYLTEKV